MVLVHGFLGSARMWAPLASRLAAHFDVVAVDLPGFGRETARTAPDSIEDFAGAVMDTVDGLHLRRFHLIGHSMGGMVAQQVALDFGARIDRLVLYGTAGSGELPGRFESIVETIQRVQAVGVKSVGRRIVRSWFVSGEADAAFDLCANEIADVTSATAVAALDAIRNWDVRPRLLELDCACLAIGGDRDRSTPANELLTLFTSLRHADLCILPRCAHAAHLERPELFASIVDRFLSHSVAPGTAAT